MKRKYEKANVTWLNESDKLESNVIYLLTFNDNGKEMYYVGRTSRRLRYRINEHLIISSHPISLLQQTVNKLKHFTISILCRCTNSNELKIKEDYYTLQYHSNEIEFGFNIHLGSKWSDIECEKKRNFMLSDMNVLRNKKHSEDHCRKNGASHSIKCRSIPDNIIFDSIRQCVEYYAKIYDNFKILLYLDNGKIHKKSGQTFVRIRD